MTTLLTEEQRKKVEEFLSIVKIQKENIKKYPLKSNFEVSALEAKKSIEEINYILNDGFYRTQELFFIKEDTGEYGTDAQKYIAEVRNPFTLMDELLKESVEPNIENLISVEYNYNNIIKPYLEQNFGITFNTYSETYYTIPLTQLQKVSKGTQEYNEIINDFSKLITCIENNEFNQAVNIATNLLKIHNNIFKAFIPTIYIISYFLYFGNATSQFLEYGDLYQSPYIFLNENFAKQTVSLRSFSSSFKQLFNNISSLTLIKNELDLINSEKFEDIKELIKIKAIEDEDIGDLTNFKKKLKTINTTADSFKSNYETLTETIQNVLDNENDYYNRLINLINPTEKQNTIDAAKASGYNVFQYIFNSDARLISLYNQPKFRSALSSGYTNFGLYSPTYYEDWKSDYEKLIEGKPNYIDLKNKLDEINSYFEVEKLLENDIEEVSTKINSLITTLKAEVLPSIRTMLGHLVFIKDLNNYSEVTGITYDPELYTPFYRGDKPKGVLDEQMVVLNLKNAVDEAVTPLTDLITNLETLLSELKTDTVEDLLKADTSKYSKIILDNITNILETVEVAKKESEEFCKKVEEASKQPLNKFINFEPENQNLNIYNIIFNNDSIDKYHSMRIAGIHDYIISSNIITILNSEFTTFFLKKPRTINSTNWYKSWCNPSIDFVKEYSNRLEPLKEQLEILKTALEVADQSTFTEAKKIAINIIEQDLHSDIAMYFIMTEIHDVNNSNNRIKTESNLYVDPKLEYNFDEIAALKFNSFAIIELLIALHKSIKDLNFIDGEIKKEVEAQSASSIKEIIEKKNKELEKEVAKTIDLPKENWGIRISPANAFTNVKIIKKEPSVDNSGKPTKEEKVNTTTDVYKQETTAFGKSWYMMLLPTMTSNLPVTGGSQAPGAQPGLNFRIVNSLVKHKIPGFGPVYQPMGIDTINCTIVGCFTGADGSDKYKIGNIDNFSDGGYNYSNDLFGLNGEIGNQSRFLDDVVHRFDSFENFQSFYNEIIQTNKEIEVEINLKKNTNVLANGSEGIFRDSTTGNPKFKGFIKRFDSYYVRDDRTWYIMDVQLTTNHIISKKCLNLTNIVKEAVPNATLEESLGVTPFNLIAECLFKDTPGVGGPPKLPELVEFGLGNNIRRLVIGSVAGKLANNWIGMTIREQGSSDKSIRMSINKDGYSVIYKVIEDKDDSTKNKYRILGKPYLTPAETFTEISKDRWNIDVKGENLVKFHCIKSFLVRPSANPDQIIDPVESITVEVSAKVLNRIGPLGFSATRKGPGKFEFVESFVDLQYNKVTGSMLMKKRPNFEYNPKNIFDPKELDKGLGFFLGDRAGIEYRNYNSLYNILKADALLEFNKNEEVEENCKNKSKEKAKTLSEDEKVDTTGSNDPEEIDIGIKFTKNDLQIKLKNYIVNNHKEFIQRNSITYTNSNQSRLYFVEDIRELSYLEEVSSQFFVDKFTIIDNEDSYFTIDVETKSLKGLRYVTPTTNFVLKLFGGTNQESANRLIITIEKKDNKPGRILRTIPYSQYTKPTQTQR